MSDGRAPSTRTDPHEDPFEADDIDDIRELDLEDVDDFGSDYDRVTVGELAGTAESWRFGHVIVDEAQDLTPMQWRMVMRRVRGRSMTVVGDLAQALDGHGRGWTERLPATLSEIDRRDLTINYRSPVEIHELAERVVARFGMDVTESRAIRHAGHPPRFVSASDLALTLAHEVASLAQVVSGQIAVIAAPDTAAEIQLGSELADRVAVLAPVQAKGLEFDGVVLVEPADILALSGGAALLYVALTRATQRLAIIHAKALPAVLTE